MPSKSRQIAELAQDLNLGKDVQAAAKAISGSALSGAMLAAGALVEHGENANGQYWRFESGLQICIAKTHVNNLNSVENVKGGFEWVFPANFINTDYYVQGQANQTVAEYGGRIVVIDTSTLSSSSSVYGYRFRTDIEDGTGGPLSLQAIGRWK